MATSLIYLSQLPDHAFTDASLQFVALRCKRTPSTAELSELLLGYLRTLAPKPAPPPLPVLDETEPEMIDRLAGEWDDPAGIRDRIRTCNGELRFLRLLGVIVAKYAPQHLGLLPPAVLTALAGDRSIHIPSIVELRRTMQPHDPVRSPTEQRDSVVESVAIARHLTPEELDRVNPLPGGLRRAPSPPTDPTATDRPSAASPPG